MASMARSKKQTTSDLTLVPYFKIINCYVFQKKSTLLLFSRAILLLVEVWHGVKNINQNTQQRQNSQFMISLTQLMNI